MKIIFILAITRVPESLKNCKRLLHLDLSCNNLQRLPDVITTLISLEELVLNEVNLEFLPANFGRLIHLRIAELRLNRLISLPKSMIRLSNLQRLDIGGNEFHELVNKNKYYIMYKNIIILYLLFLLLYSPMLLEN